MQMIKNTIIVFIILLLVSIFANASCASEHLNTDQDNTIILINAVFDPLKQPPVSEKTGVTTSQYSTGTGEYYILQFKGNVLEEWKLDVKNTGAIFFDYVPNNAFIVRMNSSVKSQVEAMDIVQWIGTYQPAYKISPVFSTYSITNTTTANAISGDVVKDIIVMLFDSKHNAQVISEIEQLGGEIVDNGGDIMRVRIGISKLSDIAGISGVSWIEKYMQPVIFNDIAADIINVSYVRNTHGLTGSGQIVAVADTGLDTGVNDDSMHDDIEGRIVTLHAWWEGRGDNGSADYQGHGTHVAGSVLGNGSCSDGQYAGMAPMAKLVFQALQCDGDNPKYNGAFLTPVNLGLLFQEAYDDGAKIHSNSWGSDDYRLYGNYTSSSQYVDQFMWDNKEMLIVFAAGNDGKNGSNTVFPPGTAKNALTVGASQSSRSGDINTIADFSSKGPTNDERIKPDVVAPGTLIYSTASSLVRSDDYMYMGGTSMATPITAGAAALVRQYYVENESLTSPSAALIKATLINGAANMGHSTNEQGWGRIDIENSLFPPSTRKMFYYDNIDLGTLESWNITFRVFNSSEPLCITVVWTDHPSATFVGKMLVNDLDLSVTGPDGSYPGNGGDNINNVERVEITSPAIGLYTITINGTNVPKGPQPFAIVASGALSPDDYLPVMNNEFPSNNSYVNNSTTNVSINITDSESGVNLSSVNMLINNNSVAFTNVSITNGYNIVNIASMPYDEGLVTVSINASDNASNPLAFNWSFTIDTILPIVTIKHPTKDHVIQVPAINLNITTNETCDIWYRHVNGTNSLEVFGVILNTTLPKLNDGHYNITTFARDLAGNLNSTMLNFTIFATPPTISAPAAGEIFYSSQNTTYVNGTTTTVVTNVSVYVNGILVNGSYPVIGGMFNISGVPLVNGINAINVTAIYNDTVHDYFSINTSLTVSVGEIFNIPYDDTNITINVSGLPTGIKSPFIDFNITGQVANKPVNISSSIVAAAPAPPASNVKGPAIDFCVPGNDSYTFNRSISLTLGFNASLVNNPNNMVVAWYNESTATWVSLRSTVNTTASTTTANITHFTVFAPIEDNTPPADIVGPASTGQTTNSITLSWTNSSDTDYVEIFRNGVNFTSVSAISYTDSGLSPGASYDYALRPVDIVGNKGNWSNITVSTKSTTSSGGGGGGGGGSSGEEY
ncbi:MAG: S8 family serine peptidase, partial [Methanosarcinaceae archaeon]